MNNTIHIGKTVIALADYAVGASAVLGIRDSGKTVTSKGIAEQLLENKIPIIVFDAVGKWRWMKVAAGYEAGGGAYNNPRGRLRSLGLIEYRGGPGVSSANLIPGSEGLKGITLGRPWNPTIPLLPRSA